MDSTHTTTRIRAAKWVIAFDEATNDHRYLRDTDVVFRGSEIVFVGSDYDGSVDEDMNGAELMVMPGMVSTHTHLNGGPFATGTSRRSA